MRAAREHRARAWAWLAALVLAAPAAARAQGTAGSPAPASSARSTPQHPTAPGAGNAAAAARPDPRDDTYERDVVEVDPAVGVTIGEVMVDNRLGDVRIEGHDRSTVVISAFKRAPDADTLDRLKVTLISEPSGPVRISTAIMASSDSRPIPSGSVRIDLVIRAPRTARVEARVWNSRLALVGMENGAELHANEGDIDVKNASGTIVTHVARGKQKFVEVFGAVDAQAITGELALDVIRGERLDASVNEGDIVGRGVQVRFASLRTIRGDIRLRGRAVLGGHYRMGSYRGNIDVQLARDIPLTVHASAKNGTVSLSPALQRQQGEDAVTGFWSLGNGTPAVVELRSRMGSVKFSLAE